MIAIIDYGMGNLRSVQKAFEKVGADACITKSPPDILKADKVVLPGVGAMAPAFQKLQDLGMPEAIRKSINDGKPFLGICLGLQLLFTKSTEGGFSQGLNILPGTVERFTQGKVPHMGWNQINIQAPGDKMYAGINTGADVYFCHSYYVNPADKNIAASTTGYGSDFISSIAVRNIWGVQFHPEKSQEIGLTILKNFTSL